MQNYLNLLQFYSAKDKFFLLQAIKCDDENEAITYLMSLKVWFLTKLLFGIITWHTPQLGTIQNTSQELVAIIGESAKTVYLVCSDFSKCSGSGGGGG